MSRRGIKYWNKDINMRLQNYDLKGVMTSRKHSKLLFAGGGRFHPEHALLGTVGKVVVPGTHVDTRAWLLELQHVSEITCGSIVELVLHLGSGAGLHVVPGFTPFFFGHLS